MNIYEALHISRGHPQTDFAVRKRGRPAGHGDDYLSREAADICLNCTREKCKGGERCFQNRKREAVTK